MSDTFGTPIDCSPPGSSVHGISQARILEWVVFPSPGDLPNSGIEPTFSASPALAGGFFLSVSHQAHLNLFLDILLFWIHLFLNIGYTFFYTLDMHFCTLDTCFVNVLYHWLICRCWKFFITWEYIPLDPNIGSFQGITEFSLLIFCWEFLHLFLSGILTCSFLLLSCSDFSGKVMLAL